jgi:hypothetical protein
VIKAFDVVALTEAIPEEGLEAGDTGTVVEIYDGGKGYDVEFFNALGETVTVITLFASQVRPLSSTDMHHVRVLTG